VREILSQVENILDNRVRPSLAEHNGDVRIISLHEGLLKLQMLGQCSNCPSAVYENEEFFAEVIKRDIPEITEVILVTGVSDSLIEAARAMMSKP